MLFLAECIRIFTTWQAIPFKRKFYLSLLYVKVELTSLTDGCVEWCGVGLALSSLVSNLLGPTSDGLSLLLVLEETRNRAGLSWGIGGVSWSNRNIQLGVSFSG